MHKVISVGRERGRCLPSSAASLLFALSLAAVAALASTAVAGEPKAAPPAPAAVAAGAIGEARPARSSGAPAAAAAAADAPALPRPVPSSPAITLPAEAGDAASRALDALLAHAPAPEGAGVEDVLVALGPAHAALLERALGDRHVDAETRAALAIALGRLRLPGAVPALARAIADPEASVAIEALGALAAIGPAAKPAAPEIAAALTASASASVRVAAAGALERIGDASSGAALVAALGDGAASVRAAARAALEKLAPRPAPRALLEELSAIARRDGEIEVRVDAASCLVALAGPGEVALVLPHAAADAPEEVRVVALAGLGPIADATARDAIVAVLSDPSPRLREAACDACADLRAPLGRAAIPALVDALRDVGPVAAAAHQALERVTGASLPATYGVWRAWADGGDE